MISSPSHVVQILLPNETQGRPIGKEWFDGFLEELTGKCRWSAQLPLSIVVPQT
jgi:hypothetical protein